MRSFYVPQTQNHPTTTIMVPVLVPAGMPFPIGQPVPARLGFEPPRHNYSLPPGAFGVPAPTINVNIQSQPQHRTYAPPAPVSASVQNASTSEESLFSQQPTISIAPSNLTTEQKIVQPPKQSTTATKKCSTPKKKLAPPSFTRQLSDPSFLLEPDSTTPELPLLKPEPMVPQYSSADFLLESKNEPDEKKPVETPLTEPALCEWVDAGEQEFTSVKPAYGGWIDAGEKEFTDVLPSPPVRTTNLVPPCPSNRSESPSSDSIGSKHTSASVSSTGFQSSSRSTSSSSYANFMKKEPVFQTVTRKRKSRVKRKDMTLISVGDVFKTEQRATIFRTLSFCENTKLKKAPSPQARAFYLRRKAMSKKAERQEGEVWTIQKGTKVEILSLNSGCAEIYTEVTFFSKAQGKEITKDVWGWICIQNRKGPVIKA